MKPKNKLPPWLKPKPDPVNVSLAVGWYTEENWKKVKEASVDFDRFEDTYPEWLAMAEDTIRDMQISGLSVDKFYVNSEELLAWCILHEKINDATARAEFVSIQSSKPDAGAA